MNRYSKYLYLSLGLGMGAVSLPAAAISQTCLSVTEFMVPQCAGNQACIAQLQANHPECFGSTSSTAASSQEIYSTSIQQILSVSKALSFRTNAFALRDRPKVVDNGQYTGLAAGNTTDQWNIWGNINNDTNKYDRGNYNSAGGVRRNTFNTDVTNLVLGGDYQFSPTLVSGLSLGLDRTRGTGESFNAGVSQGVAAQRNSGYTLAPYLGWQLSNDWSMDATLGFGNVKTDTDGIKGSTDRLFYGANLNYATWRSNWQLTGKGSYLHGEEKSGNLTNTLGTVMAGTASKNSVDQLRLEGQAGYWLNDNAMPYFGLGYANDLSRSTTVSAAAQLGNEIGSNALLWTIGVNFFSLSNSLTGGISYSQESGRTYSNTNNLMGNINVRF